MESDRRPDSSLLLSWIDHHPDVNIVSIAVPPLSQGRHLRRAPGRHRVQPRHAQAQLGILRAAGENCNTVHWILKAQLSTDPYLTQNCLHNPT